MERDNNKMTLLLQTHLWYQTIRHKCSEVLTYIQLRQDCGCTSKLGSELLICI